MVVAFPPYFSANLLGLSAISLAPAHNSLPPPPPKSFPPPKSWPFTFHSAQDDHDEVVEQDKDDNVDNVDHDKEEEKGALPFSNFLVRLIKSVTNWRPAMPLIAPHSGPHLYCAWNRSQMSIWLQQKQYNVQKSLLRNMTFWSRQNISFCAGA